MAKHKTVTHLPAPPPASAPRLLAQLLTVLGELIVAGVFLVGLAAIAAWLVAGYDTFSRLARPDLRPPGTWVHCWRDRYGGEICRPEDRGPSGYRRHYARY